MDKKGTTIWGFEKIVAMIIVIIVVIALIFMIFKIYGFKDIFLKMFGG